MAARGAQAPALPLLADFEPGDIASELPDMMGYDVEGDGEQRAFRHHAGRRAADRHLWQ